MYAKIRYPDGRESNVSLKDLSGEDSNGNRDDEEPGRANNEDHGIAPEDVSEDFTGLGRGIGIAPEDVRETSSNVVVAEIPRYPAQQNKGIPPSRYGF